jgi:hypothetical protein
MTRPLHFAISLFVAVLLFAFSPTAPSFGASFPVPGNGQTLLWASAEWTEDGLVATSRIDQPLIVTTRQLTTDELMALCYDTAGEEDQLRDCLATFEPVSPDPQAGRKIAPDDLAVLAGHPSKPVDVYLELTPLSEESPIDKFLEFYYVARDLFDAGILDKGGVLSELIENEADSRMARFASVKGTLVSIPDVSFIDHLVGLDFVHVLMPLAAVKAVESLPWVARIHVPEPGLEAEAFTVEPPAILNHLQLRGYFVHDDGSAGYDGEYDMPDPYWTNVVVATLDSNGYNADHVAFNDTSGGGTRVKQAWTCEDGCSQIVPPTDMTADFFSDKPEHGTLVAGILGGDIRDGQDLYWTTTGQRIYHSGQAPEVEFVLIEPEGEAAYIDALDRAVSSHVHVISLSSGFYHTSACGATSGVSAAANATYKNGILTVASAGNGRTGGYTCTVAAPADAAGALPVAGIGDGSELTLGDWNGSDLWSGNSHGPHTYHGTRVRTVIDLVAPACFNYFPQWAVDGGADGYYYDDVDPKCGTSVSQPLVAAVLVDILDFMLGVKDDTTFLLPGVQKVFLLEMGDRAIDPNTRCASGYNAHWGAGRTRVRRFDDGGMDAPWGRQNGYVCVGDGEEVIIPVRNGQMVPSGADALKAAIWWYTDDFSSPVPNDIDLWLQWSNDGSSWSTISSDTGTDLK